MKDFKLHLALWLILILSVIGGNCFAQIITYPAYTSYFNVQTGIPDSVIWVAKPHTKAVGREAGFHATGNRA